MKDVPAVKQNFRSRLLGVGALAAAAGSFVMASASSSYAGITELLAAVDIDGAETAVQTFMVALVAVGLLFLGYKLLKKMGVAV